jgi:4-hydroxybenzoate polyprenyltransferase
MAKIKNLFSFLFKEFVYNGHLQSLGSAGLVYIASILSDNPVSWYALIATYTTLQAVYFNDRYQDYDNDIKTNAERTKHLSLYIHRIPLLIYTFVVISFLLVLVFSGNPWAILFVSLILILGFAYPIYFKELTKKIPLFKNFYVASVFGFICFFGILFDGVNLVSVLFEKLLPIFAVFTFFKGILMQIALDIKDTEADKERGLKTLSVLIGDRKAIISFRVLNLASAIFFVLASLSPFSLVRGHTSTLLILTILNYFLNEIYIRVILSKNKYGYILAAGTFMIWTIIVLLTRMIIV